VPRKLLAELRSLIEATRSGVAQAVNSAQVLLYWEVEQRIQSEILRHDRAAYGEEIVATVRCRESFSRRMSPSTSWSDASPAREMLRCEKSRSGRSVNSGSGLRVDDRTGLTSTPLAEKAIRLFIV
jgi:hypothetical protein